MSTVLTFASRYAEETGGQFTEYDATKAVIVVPLDGGRYQTVLALSRQGDSGKQQVVFVSKICEMEQAPDLQSLLARNAGFDYARFVAEDGYLKVEAAALEDSATETQVKEMIAEVARVADQFEMKFTGQDVH